MRKCPAAQKRTPPRYQTLRSADLPTADGDGWRAVVVAGTMFGVEGTAATHTDIGYAHVSMRPGASISVVAPADHNAGAYVFSGSVCVGPDRTDHGGGDPELDLVLRTEPCRAVAR